MVAISTAQITKSDVFPIENGKGRSQESYNNYGDNFPAIGFPISLFKEFCDARHETIGFFEWNDRGLDQPAQQ